MLASTRTRIRSGELLFLETAVDESVPPEFRMPKVMQCIFALVLFFSQSASAQLGEHFRTLVINENSGKVVVMQKGDQTYIDIRRFVQIAHGSIAYEGNRIVLTIVCSAVNGPATVEMESPTSSRLTRDFMKAGIEEISLMREWASTLANAVQNGYPVTDDWVASYRGKAQTGLELASAAVSSSADRDGFQMLKGEFEAIREWSNRLLEARKSMDTAKYSLSPGALQGELLSQKIVACARFLGQMLASGNVQDDPACH